MGIIIAFCCFLFHWPCFVAHEILVLPPPVEPADPELEAPSLESGLPGKSLGILIGYRHSQMPCDFGCAAHQRQGFLSPYPPLHSTMSQLKAGRLILPSCDLTPQLMVNFLVAVPQSCLTLCNLMGCSLSSSFIHGILQARIPEWVAISFCRGSSRPRDQTLVSCTAGGFFTSEPLRI